MTVDEFKKMLAELNHEVINFKAIEEQRKNELSRRHIPSKLTANKQEIKNRSRGGSYK